VALGRAVAKNGETRWTTNALVGGVQRLEAPRDRSDEGMNADERRSCSGEITGWQNVSGMPENDPHLDAGA
jgi:hypothetical protein